MSETGMSMLMSSPLPFSPPPRLWCLHMSNAEAPVFAHVLLPLFPSLPSVLEQQCLSVPMFPFFSQSLTCAPALTVPITVRSLFKTQEGGERCEIAVKGSQWEYWILNLMHVHFSFSIYWLLWTPWINSIGLKSSVEKKVCFACL